MSDPHYSNFKLKMKICALKIILNCLNKIYILAFKSWVAPKMSFVYIFGLKNSTYSKHFLGILFVISLFAL